MYRKILYFKAFNYLPQHCLYLRPDPHGQYANVPIIILIVCKSYVNSKKTRICGGQKEHNLMAGDKNILHIK